MGGKGAERSAARAIRALKGSIRVELFSHSGFYLVAVGTIIADRPPHRTVRAALPHTAPTLEGWREVLLLAHRSILGTLFSFPALCRVSVGRNDVLLGPRPSLPRLRRRSLFFVRLVHRYYGAVRLL